MINLEWLYSNLITIILVLAIAMVILFLFPVLLGIDLLSKNKDKK